MTKVKIQITSFFLNRRYIESSFYGWFFYCHVGLWGEYIIMHLSEVSLRLTRLLRLGGLAGFQAGEKNQGQKGWANVTGCHWILIGGHICKDANGDAFLGGQFFFADVVTSGWKGVSFKLKVTEVRMVIGEQ